jgi:hypothetical protein
VKVRVGVRVKHDTLFLTAASAANSLYRLNCSYRVRVRVRVWVIVKVRVRVSVSLGLVSV